MNRITFVAAGLLLVAAGCRQQDSMNASHMGMNQMKMEGTEQYAVTFIGAWNATTHPFEYPPVGLLTGPHFSGLIGTTHDTGYTLFRAGMRPTPGLERLAEEGKHSPLDQEINAQIGAGKAGALFETDPIKDMSMSVSTRFTIDAKHPLVSAVAMIAPSPDWFAGAADVSLMENGAWVASKAVTLWAYDAGGDAGTTYEAGDADANPKQPTMENDAPAFKQMGARVPVGTLVFVRQ